MRPALTRLALISWCAVAFFMLLGASCARPLTVQVAIPSLEALPRETVNLALQLENTGDAPWRSRLELKLPPGWRAVLEPGEVALEPDESYLALFTVLVSGRAKAGEYTLPVTYNDSAGVEVSATYIVRVKEVRELEMVLLEAPLYVIAAPYTARFSVRNVGNRSEEVVLQARDNLSLPLLTRPRQVQLAPGETVEIIVKAGVDTNLSQSQSHYLYFVGSARDDPEVAGRASATVELIPRSLSEASAYHLFPLNVRLNETLSTGIHPVLDRFGGFNLSVSGAGQLWDGDPGTLDLQLSVGSGQTGQKNLVSYESPSLQVVAGEQSFDLSPLTASRNGLGLNAQHSFGLLSGDRLEAQALVYGNPTEVGVGLRASAVLSQHYEFSAYSLISGVPYGTVVGGQILLHPELEGLSKLNLEAEYGLQTNSSAHSFRFGGEVEAGGNTVSATWQQAQAGFQGAASDGYTLSLASVLELSETSSTYANVKFDQKASYLPGELLVAPPKKLESSWAGRFATSVLGIGWSVGYEHANSFGPTITITSTKREFTFGISSPLPDNVLLIQYLSWLQEFSRTTNDKALGYEVSAYVPLERGSLIPRVSGDYSLIAGRPSKVSLGVGWSSLVGDGDRVALDLEGDLELLNERSLGLSAVGSYTFDNGQALDLDFSGRSYYSGREPNLEVSLGYNVPFDTPLARLSTVGTVKGRFQDELGAGIPNLVVQLGGLSVLTQADGSFTFPAVPKGNHMLVLNAASAAPDVLTLPGLPYRVQMRAGETVVTNFRVVRPAAVQGRVHFIQVQEKTLDATPGSDVIFGQGQPEREADLVQDLVVELSNSNDVLRTRTDNNGQFQFQLLPPGQWKLTVVRGALSELYRLEPQIRLLTVAAGETARVAIRLVPVARNIEFMEGGALSTP